MPKCTLHIGRVSPSDRYELENETGEPVPYLPGEGGRKIGLCSGALLCCCFRETELVSIGVLVGLCRIGEPVIPPVNVGDTFVGSFSKPMAFLTPKGCVVGNISSRSVIR